MAKHAILDKLPREGFLKINSAKPAPLPSDKKIALNRKGNALFNAGDIEGAKRIFLTTGYTDGIMRIGDYHFGRNEILEAYKMYWLAPAPDKVAMMTEQMAAIVRKWLKEKGDT
jgi:hypothetical protein